MSNINELFSVNAFMMYGIGVEYNFYIHIIVFVEYKEYKMDLLRNVRLALAGAPAGGFSRGFAP